MEILESQILSFEFKTIVFLAGRSVSYKDIGITEELIRLRFVLWLQF